MKIFSLYPYQIIISLISLLFIIDRIIKFLKKETRQSVLKIVASIFIWASIFSLAVFPTFATGIMNFIGIYNHTEAFILIGFTVTFMLIYKLLSVIEDLDKNITELVRENALRVLKEKK